MIPIYCRVESHLTNICDHLLRGMPVSPEKPYENNTSLLTSTTSFWQASLRRKRSSLCGCLYSARHFSLFLVENIHETFCSYVLMVNSVFFFILFWYSSDRRLCQYDIISILPDAGRYWRARCLSIFPALLFVFPKPYHLY